MHIDLNADLGETTAGNPVADDAAMLELVSSANVATGFHAGDPHSIAATLRDAAAHGLHFAGRPPFSDDPARNQMLVREAMGRARVVLAFSNLVSPAPYTHPTRDYLTGRWTDALAAGCLVAGTAPASAASLLWPGATVEISPTSRDDAWPVLAQLASEWTPQAAADRQSEARRRLDWRYRLRDLCMAMDWAVPDRLTAELATL